MSDTTEIYVGDDVPDEGDVARLQGLQAQAPLPREEVERAMGSMFTDADSAVPIDAVPADVVQAGIIAGSEPLIDQPDRLDESPQKIATGINHEILDQLDIEVRGYRGESPAMERCLEFAAAYAKLRAPIFVEGETGTGKRDLVKAIHRASGRSGRLITIDCSQVPNGLLASTLFGHNKGSFTGAVKDQVGLIEQADGGTLYLDEVENLPPDVQQMLLQPLDSKNGNVRMRRLGNGASHDFNVRVICATNTELEPLVKQGKFRADLFHRISSLRLRVPALRQRGKPYMRGLIEYLLEEITRENFSEFLQPGVRIEVHPELLEALLSNTWPGNVRELNNVLCQAITNAILVREDLTLRMEDVGQLLVNDPVGNGIGEIRRAIAGAPPLFESMIIVYFEQLLTATGGNVKDAAKIAGLSRTALHGKLKRIGLDAAKFR